MFDPAALRPTRRPLNSPTSMTDEGGRYDTAPFASRSRPPNGANFINQLFAGAFVMFMALRGRVGLVGLVRWLCGSCVEVLAIAATGATAIRAPRPIATYFLIIAVPLEASLPTLVSRTSSLCASHAELKMNVGFSCRSPGGGAQSCRMRLFWKAATSPAPIEDRADSLPPHFCELPRLCRDGFLPSPPFRLQRSGVGEAGR